MKFKPSVNAKKARSCKDGAKNPVDGGVAVRPVAMTIQTDFPAITKFIRRTFQQDSKHLPVSAQQSTTGNKMIRQSRFHIMYVRKTYEK